MSSFKAVNLKLCSKVSLYFFSDEKLLDFISDEYKAIVVVVAVILLAMFVFGISILLGM